MNDDPNSGRLGASTAAPVGAGPARPASGLDPAGRDRIARGLRLLYAEVVAQPIPAALAALAADLAARLEEPR